MTELTVITIIVVDKALVTDVGTVSCLERFGSGGGEW